MKILGPRLLAPKGAAIVLAIYAVGYGGFLVVMLAAVAAQINLGLLILIGLLGLAATPFIAVAHLARATDAESEHPPRPTVMAIVMAAPTVFWLWATAEAYHPYLLDRPADVAVVFIFTTIPGLLALWLSVTFVLLAMCDRPARTAIE